MTISDEATEKIDDATEPLEFRAHNGFEDFPIIDRFTREDAHRDQIFFSVDKTAAEIGYKFPVSVSRHLWHSVLVPPEGTKGYQDIEGRIFDTLWILKFAIRQAKESTDTIQFAPLYVTQAGRPATPILLKALCHPGDSGEPVISIFCADETTD